MVSAKGNTSSDLLAAWFQSRLGVEPVEQKTSRGPGITAVRLFTPAGPIALTRPTGAIATFSIPGQPDRPVALKRRSAAELLSEELRRLDPDDVYAQTLSCLVERDKQPAAEKKLEPAERRMAETAAKKAAVKTATAPVKTTTKKAAPGKKIAPSSSTQKGTAEKGTARKGPARKGTAKKGTAKKAAKRS